jgi:hypothetical protein
MHFRVTDATQGYQVGKIVGLFSGWELSNGANVVNVKLIPVGAVLGTTQPTASISINGAAALAQPVLSVVSDRPAAPVGIVGATPVLGLPSAPTFAGAKASDSRPVRRHLVRLVALLTLVLYPFNRRSRTFEATEAASVILNGRRGHIERLAALFARSLDFVAALPRVFARWGAKVVLPRAQRSVRRGLPVLLAAILASRIRDVVSVHPLKLTRFGAELVGEVAQVVGRFVARLAAPITGYSGHCASFGIKYMQITERGK